MIKVFLVDLTIDKKEITIKGKQELQATTVHVPGDISSAAFLIVAAAIVPQSRLTLKNVGLNKTRSGILDVLKQMAVNYSISILPYVSLYEYRDLMNSN